MKVSAPLLCLILALPLSASAKDLSGRFGFGVNNVGPNSAPSLSVDWQASEANAFEGLMAANTDDDNKKFDIGLRYTRNLFIESNQHFFFFMGAQMLSRKVSGKNDNGYGLEGGAGARVFLSGLPNLGLSFGGGFQLDSVDDVSIYSKAFFGVHYYF